MNPWQIATSKSEHSEQTALFCFCAKAQLVGFPLAFQQASYDTGAVKILTEAKLDRPIPELAFYHSIPNGGNRGDTKKSRTIEGGRMKAEGVKAGVLDTFWPLRRSGFSGLYIELKRESLRKTNDRLNGCSDEQIAFGQFVSDNGFFATVCYGWKEAARQLEAYYSSRV